MDKQILGLAGRPTGKMPVPPKEFNSVIPAKAGIHEVRKSLVEKMDSSFRALFTSSRTLLVEHYFKHPLMRTLDHVVIRRGGGNP